MKNLPRLASALALAVLTGACSTHPGEAVHDALQRGDRYLAQKKYAEAIIEYRKAVQTDARSVDARTKLGEAYLANRDGVEALREYARAAELSPDDLKLQLTAGALLQLAGAFEDAKALAEGVLNKDPRNVAAQILRGQALLGLRDPDAAILQVKEAITLDPNQSGYTALGTMELAKGRRDEAEAAFRKAVEINPRSVQAQLAMGYFFWEARQLQDAEQSFAATLEIDPGNLPAHRMLSTLYMATNQVPKAEVQLKALAAAGPEGILNLADFYLTLNRLDEASAVLKTIASDSKVSTGAEERQALIEFRRGRPLEADQIIDALLRREPRNVDALITKTRFLIVGKRTGDALTYATRAVDADPNSALAHYLLGGLHAARSNPDGALAAFAAVLKLNPLAVAAHVQVGQLRLALGDSKAALSAADAALRIQPFNPDARLLQAQALLTSGDVRGAERDLSILLKRYPESSAVQTQLGRLAAHKGDTAAATRFYQRALELHPGNRNALDGLVGLYIRANRPVDGRRLVEAQLAASPNDPLLLMLAVGAYEAEHNVAATEETLKKVIAIDPSNLSAYGKLGRLYISTGRLDAARDEFAKAGARQPPSVPALTMVGLILEEQHQKEQAIQQYERIMEIDANAGVAANNLAWLYVESDQNLDVALTLAQKAKERIGSNASVNDTLGWIFYKKEMLTRAIPLFEESAQQDAANPMYRYHLGLAYAKAGDRTNAKRAFNDALRRKPDYMEAAVASAALGGN